MTTAPTINLNGSHGPQLFEDTLAAMDALRAAIEAVQATSPNGRDYQTAAPGTFTKAQFEHFARVEKLTTVLDELETIAVAIQGQNRHQAVSGDRPDLTQAARRDQEAITALEAMLFDLGQAR